MTSKSMEHLLFQPEEKQCTLPWVAALDSSSTQFNFKDGDNRKIQLVLGYRLFPADNVWMTFSLFLAAKLGDDVCVEEVLQSNSTG